MAWLALGGKKVLPGTNWFSDEPDILTGLLQLFSIYCSLQDW
jgi:hypothetical protein